jgi:hypothetical protein
MQVLVFACHKRFAIGKNADEGTESVYIMGVATMDPMVRRNLGPELERALPVIDNFFLVNVLLSSSYMFFFILMFCFHSDCYRWTFQ